MQRIGTVIGLLAALCATGGSARGEPVFVIAGFGYGHGVGMGQYGALGQAQNGATYDRILAHYYPGTELGPAPVASVRVLLVAGNDEVAIGSRSPFTVSDGAGATYAVPAGTIRLGTSLELELAGERRALSEPVRVEPGDDPLELGLPYRGALVISRAGPLLRVVNDVPLEQYLYGVVAGEMPADWPAEALKTQAVAARSYALATRNPAGAFDLYADTRSQVYGGLRREDARTSAAVDATAGQVLLFEGRVATTFFSSSSGGRTAAVEEAFSGSRPVPYLVSVEDPEDEVSPYHRWGPVVLGARELSRRLGGTPTAVRDVLVSPSASGRTAAITVIGDPEPVEIHGWTVRNALGLRSSWFSVGVLDLARRPGRAAFRQPLTLTGLARGVAGARLEARSRGGEWEAVAELEPFGDGSFAVDIRPEQTATYRIAAPVLAGSEVELPSLTVLVAPRIALRRGARRSLFGAVRPARPGTVVTLQRKRGSRWIAVESGEPSAGGRFRFAARAERGRYRVVASVPGLARGASRVAEVGA